MLIGLLVPAAQKARGSAQRTACVNNLRQLALAVHAYHDSEGRFPYNQFLGPHGGSFDSRAWSWLARLLPYLEEQNLYREGGIPHKTLRQSNVHYGRMKAEG